MPKNEDKKPARIIKASLALQSRVGKGPVSHEKIRRAQEVMESNTTDFVPLGRQYLTDIEKALEAFRRGEAAMADTLQSLRRPVMEIKANATLFHYPLAGRLAMICLGFLESIQELDEPALEIMDAHQTAQNLVLSGRATEGDKTGQKLEQELQDACRRYFAKKEIDPGDAFFVEF